MKPCNCKYSTYTHNTSGTTCSILCLCKKVTLKNRFKLNFTKKEHRERRRGAKQTVGALHSLMWLLPLPLPLPLFLNCSKMERSLAPLHREPKYWDPLHKDLPLAPNALVLLLLLLLEVVVVVVVALLPVHILMLQRAVAFFREVLHILHFMASNLFLYVQARHSHLWGWCDDCMLALSSAAPLSATSFCKVCVCVCVFTNSSLIVFFSLRGHFLERNG